MERLLYIVRNSWFRLLYLKVIKKNEELYIVKVEGLQNDDAVVYSGVPLLRIAHIAALGGLKGVDID